MRMVWVVEDEPVCGTFTDYVRNWESAHYSDHYVSSVVWVVEGFRLVETPVAITRDPVSDNDYYTVTLVAAGQVAHVTIDGRS